MATIRKKPSFSSQNPDDLSWISEISRETLIKVLIRKNIIIPNDLIEEERHTRAQPSPKPATIHHHHSSHLKRFASHHKWGRRITARLFGWEWKKVKPTSTNNPDHD
jgi:hypothetical protein